MAENCWDFLKCEKDKMVNCLAYPRMGSFCWLVAGPLGERQPVCHFLEDFKTCFNCPWYKKLAKEAATSS